MFLRSAVLDLVRGAAGASLILAVGCSGSEPIRQEPAATLAPLHIAAPPPAASPPSVVLVPTPAPVEVTPLEVTPAPLVVATPEVAPAAPARRRGHRRARPPNAAYPLPPDVMAACGRG